MKPLDDWVWSTGPPVGHARQQVRRDAGSSQSPPGRQPHRPGRRPERRRPRRSRSLLRAASAARTSRSVCSPSSCVKVICGYARRHASTNAQPASSAARAASATPPRWSTSSAPTTGTRTPTPSLPHRPRPVGAMETMIRTVPEQYLWMHRVWRGLCCMIARGQAVPQGAVREAPVAPLDDQRRAGAGGVAERTGRGGNGQIVKWSTGQIGGAFPDALGVAGVGENLVCDSAGSGAAGSIAGGGARAAGGGDGGDDVVDGGAEAEVLRVACGALERDHGDAAFVDLLERGPARGLAAREVGGEADDVGLGECREARFLVRTVVSGPGSRCTTWR